MSFVLQGFYEAFIYRRKQGYLYTSDPLIKLFTLLPQLVVLFLGSIEVLLLLLLVSLSEGMVNKLWGRLFEGVKSVFIPILIIFSMISFFRGIYQAAKVVLIILGFIVTFTTFIQTTTPSEIVRTLEKLRIPLKYAYGAALAIKLVPEIASDALDTILSFTLRGEFRTKVSLGSISKVVAALSASAITKTRYLGEALAVKGFASKTRKSTYYPHIGWIEIGRFCVFLSLPIFQFLVHVPVLPLLKRLLLTFP